MALNPKEFISQNVNSLRTGMLVVILLLLFVVVSSGGLSGAGTWTAAIFALLLTMATLGLGGFEVATKNEMFE